MRGPGTALRTIRLVARGVQLLVSVASLVGSLTGGVAGRPGRPTVDDSGSLDDLLSRLDSSTESNDHSGGGSRADREDEGDQNTETEDESPVDDRDETAASITVENDSSIDTLLSRLQDVQSGATGSTGERSEPPSDPDPTGASEDATGPIFGSDTTAPDQNGTDENGTADSTPDDTEGGPIFGDSTSSDPTKDSGPDQSDHAADTDSTPADHAADTDSTPADHTAQTGRANDDAAGETTDGDTGTEVSVVDEGADPTVRDGRTGGPPQDTSGAASVDGSVGEVIVENAHRSAASESDDEPDRDAPAEPTGFEDPATFDDGGLSVKVEPGVEPEQVGGSATTSSATTGSATTGTAATSSTGASESAATTSTSPETTTRVGALAERTIEAASDAGQAVREETADGILSGGAGLLTRTLRRGPGGPGSLRREFARWRMGRPFWGGLVMLLSAGFIGYMPFWVVVHLATVPGSIAFVGVVFAILVGLSGAFAMILPKMASFFGAAGMSFAILSIVGGALGGMFVGTLVGIVGGAMIIAWEPPERPDVAIDARPEV